MQRFFKTIWSGWLNQVGFALSVVTLLGALVSQLTGKDIRVPPWVLLTIGIMSLLTVLIRIWHKADQFQRAFKSSVESRCKKLAKEWSELAQLNGGNIAEPLNPTWRSAEIKFIPFRIGELQGLTYSLMADMMAVFPRSTAMNHRTSLQELLLVLDEYKDQIKSII